MSVLVTGATGFIGSQLCQKINTNKWQARRVFRSDGEQNGVTVGDIGPVTDWTDALVGVECVVHLAARVHMMREHAADPLIEFKKVNTDGTLKLARQSATAGVSRFIYLSSIKVNGEQNQTGCLFSADDNPAPLDTYGESKHEAEQGLLAIANETEMEVVILRPPLVYGPGVKGNFLTMLDWLDKGIPLPLGAINNQRSMVGIDNLIDLIITCIVHPAAANQIFLVSDDEDMSTTELLRRLSRALGKPARLLPIPSPLLQLGAKLLGKQNMAQRLLGDLQVDISRTKQMLEWAPPYSVDEELRKTANWYLSQR